MILSKWTVSQLGILSYKGGSLSSHRRVIYIDDHALFRSAVIDQCIKPFFPNVHMREFSDGNDAYEHIKNELRANCKIDLIITDINHLGMGGKELVNEIRFLEAFMSPPIHIPILILSMVEESFYSGLGKNTIVDRYLTKATEAEDIAQCLEEILYP